VVIFELCGYIGCIGLCIVVLIIVGVMWVVFVWVDIFGDVGGGVECL